MEKNTADKSVVKQEVKTLRSRVSVITRHVRFRFGSSLREMPPVWPVEKDRVIGPFRGWNDGDRGGEMSKERQL